ncbi:GGDEF domain-containing protein [Paraglaciecola sp. L3A3]|uniref:GGDEF domain-containing protein n=1 Tax=Paraglaciecola sp. L3A3 TaxID=2686358 RepID=UPI00131AB071|nr:GGDEF domain-containing protein [Paraglaciecola sp. L3A3]
MSEYQLKACLVKYKLKFFLVLAALFLNLYCSLLFANTANKNITEAEQSVVSYSTEIAKTPVLVVEQLQENQQSLNMHLFLIILLAFSVCALVVIIIYKGVKYKREMVLLTSTDELTGLANRRQILQQLDNELEQSQSYKTQLSIALLDLDWFKQLNDKYGYFTGDKVLKLFANSCEENLRQADFVGRLGGEEFLFILPCTESEGAYQVMENLRLKMTELTAEINLPDLNVTISVGICQFQVGDNVEDIMNIADTALFRAKQNGRNQVVVGDRRESSIVE